MTASTTVGYVVYVHVDGMWRTRSVWRQSQCLTTSLCCAVME